ncbi:MAG: hypothetical protein Q9213_004197 [Squamulea squamosa]
MTTNPSTNAANSTGNSTLDTWFGGAPVNVQAQAGIQLRAFFLNLATYLVQHRLRVDAVPANPIQWIRRIFSIRDDELKTKCGLDGYLFIRFLRAILIIFLPLMVILVAVLLPINYNKGKGNRFHTTTSGDRVRWNVAGLDTLSLQNVDPARTNRYWAHLVGAIMVICWTLYRIYHEKLHFIDARQRFLTSPEHRLKASARTILVTNIPSEYRSKEALEALYDVFVDNDDRSKLTVWVNRDYKSLRTLVARRRSLRHNLEKEELRLLRLCNKEFCKSGEASEGSQKEHKNLGHSFVPDEKNGIESDQAYQILARLFEQDCTEETQQWHSYLKPSATSQIRLIRGKSQEWMPASFFKFWESGEKRRAPRIAWLRIEIARLNLRIEELLSSLDNDELFRKQNSAFIQFDRQMKAHMACSLVSHSKAGRMSPRFLEVAPHEVIWSNMDVTSLGRFIRSCVAIILLVAMLLLWAIPTTILGSLSQLDSLMAKLDLRLDISVVKIVPQIVDNPVSVPTLLATNIPTSANYFFNYLIVQSLGFSSSILSQYLRILYITTIWPWFTQTPREEAWLQTTIPHQMWGNVYPLFTNFAVIGFIFSVVSPLILVFISITFSLFWIAYRHNYYYVQRNKIDTHGLLFNNALSQLFAGIYVMEIALIGLFLLVQDPQENLACKAQAIVMIIVLILTAVFHFVMEQHLRPLYEFLPVTVEDSAVDAERQLFITHDEADTPLDAGNSNVNDTKVSDMGPTDTLDGSSIDRPQTKSNSMTAWNARKALLRLGKVTAARITDIQLHLPDAASRREVGDQLSAAIAGYPDELTDLTLDERAAQLKAAFQDPVTRESAPVIWIPQDPAGISEDVIKQAAKYGRFLEYSNSGAYLTAKNKCQITQPAPDTRPDWLLDWVL